jgi:hypothetical protein
LGGGEHGESLEFFVLVTKRNINISPFVEGSENNILSSQQPLDALDKNEKKSKI